MTFRPGDPKPPGSGRTKGTPNRTTKALRDALLTAADLAGGVDGAGNPKGVQGFLLSLAQDDPKTFAQLLGRILPTESKVENAGPMVVLKDFTGGKSVAGKAKETPLPPKVRDSKDILSPPSEIN